MPHDARKILEDMRIAAERIARFTASCTFEEFSANDLVQSAVERQFEVVGEALNRLLKLDPALAAEIPEHRRIIDFRNVLIHGYDRVNLAIVWDVVKKDLPAFKQQVECLITGPGRPD